jgi:hypothetical protein
MGVQEANRRTPKLFWPGLPGLAARAAGVLVMVTWHARLPSLDSASSSTAFQQAAG